MNYTKIVLADRLVLPFREATKRSLKHPFVQLSFHAQDLVTDSGPVFVLVGFRRDEIINHFYDFLFISNPSPTVERKSKDISHCLAFVGRETDLLIIESDANIGHGEIDAVVASGISCIFEAAKLSAPEEFSYCFYIRSNDRHYFESSLSSNESFDELLRQLTDQFEFRKPHTSETIASPKKKARSGRLARRMVFDQQ